MKARAM